MVACAGCGNPIGPDGDSVGLRDTEAVYHVRCAPTPLLAAAGDEYEAILRKGVSYFVGKYGSPSHPAEDPGSTFLIVGNAIRVERQRRGGA